MKWYFWIIGNISNSTQFSLNSSTCTYLPSDILFLEDEGIFYFLNYAGRKGWIGCDKSKKMLINLLRKGSYIHIYIYYCLSTCYHVVHCFFPFIHLPELNYRETSLKFHESYLPNKNLHDYFHKGKIKAKRNPQLICIYMKFGSK